MKQLFTFFSVMAVLLANFATGYAQPTFTQNANGVRDEREGLYAITGATVFTHYNKKIENATLIIRKGLVEAVGANLSIPEGAVVIDAKGKFIYPSFIDPYTNYGMPELPKREGGRGDFGPQTESNTKGAFNWNEAIKPEFNAADSFNPDAKRAKEFRESGFGTVLTHQTDGIARGSGALVTLGEGKPNELFVKDKSSAHYSFSKGSSRQDYPSSQMGVIALLRQTYYDALWYAKAQPDLAELNLSLDAWNKLQTIPQIFEVGDNLEALRADKIGDEFGIQYLIKGDGSEYQRLDEVKATSASFILPLNFPDAYDVENPFDAMNVELSKMKHWEFAPSNPSLLVKAGMNIAFTTYGLKDMGQFAKNLRKAIKRGLSEEDALKALTYNPANMLGVYNTVGSLEKGKLANFIISAKSIFDEKTTLHENWINGKRFAVKTWNIADITGTFNLNVAGVSYNLQVSGTPEMSKMSIKLADTTKTIDTKHTLQDLGISLYFSTDKDSLNQDKLGKGVVRLSGWVSPEDRSWKGSGTDANGKWIEWNATRTGDAPKKVEDDKNEAKNDSTALQTDKPDDKDSKDPKKPEKPEVLGSITYPFTAYGWTERPQAKTVLFKNATVWTNEADGILPNTDVLIQNGKVSAIGKNLTAPKDADQVDATGKHLTCGIIDEHSHIAISKGVNEGTQASSAEVSIATVVNSDDINIYRHLAGGVTTVQQLHGSANPIGGQASLIKLRWGLNPESLKFEGAPGFIKFALGENVKQSNWGDFNTTRFPQTRMGVEQVYIDAFTRAREYGNALKAAASAKKAPNAKPIRRDLELETLLEILESKRFITCHSYVQSEITMLMRVAEQFGFKVNTFTHILEGYKVADKMKQHGVAASSFSDWWAYKYEVQDAIPHNGAILSSMGVVTGFNSDDAEMARRLNQEAAKAVKYGGISEEEAWKFVTLNPAKMLRIDNRVGSIKKGKDADVVLWSDNPLSIYAQPIQTYVDGVKYFDLQQDGQIRVQIAQERNRLIQKMLDEKAKGGDTQKPMPTKKRLYHCDDLDDHEQVDFYHQEENAH